MRFWQTSKNISYVFEISVSRRLRHVLESSFSKELTRQLVISSNFIKRRDGLNNHLRLCQKAGENKNIFQWKWICFWYKWIYDHGKCSILVNRFNFTVSLLSSKTFFEVVNDWIISGSRKWLRPFLRYMRPYYVVKNRQCCYQFDFQAIIRVQVAKKL